jgi:hypothetical protein
MKKKKAQRNGRRASGVFVFGLAFSFIVVGRVVVVFLDVAALVVVHLLSLPPPPLLFPVFFLLFFPLTMRSLKWLPPLS